MAYYSTCKAVFRSWLNFGHQPTRKPVPVYAGIAIFFQMKSWSGAGAEPIVFVSLIQLFPRFLKFVAPQKLRM